jgi:hypothetical protein
MTKLATSVVLATIIASGNAFAPPASTGVVSRQCSSKIFSEPESASVADAIEDKVGDDSTFDAVEKMGKGAAKVRKLWGR